MLNILRSHSARIWTLSFNKMNQSAKKQFVERLHSSSATGQVKDVQSLIKGGVDVNTKNDRGWTPMMLAARNGNTEVIQVLLANGGDPTVINSLGQTAAEIAKFWNHQDVCDILTLSDSVGESLQGQLTEPVRNFFCHNPLDYGSEKRKDLAWISARLEDPSSSFILMSDLKPLVFKKDTGGRSKMSLCILRHNDIKDILIHKPVTVFLGNELLSSRRERGDDSKAAGLTMGDNSPPTSDKGDNLEHISSTMGDNCAHSSSIMGDNSTSSWFVVNTGTVEESELTKLCDNSELMNPFPGILQLSKKDAAICAQARTMLDWHERYKFCPTCGSTMNITEGGHKKVCSNTECSSNKGVSNVSYPRSDPSVIMLVVSHDGQRCILGRQKRFPAGMWSCLAGFMEPGESIEDCCRREVKEESDITVGHVQYHSSQPWPFPCSLMIGCLAYAKSEKIMVDKDELEDARWFTRQQVAQMLTRQHADGLYVPPEQAIAHQLVKSWVKQTSNL